MMGETVGEVLASHDPAFAPGDIVVGAYGWASHVVTPGARLTKIVPPAGVPLSAYLGVLGMPGVTAYSGMTDIGQVQAGRDGGDFGCLRRGRLGGGAARQARRRKSHRRRRRSRQMHLRARNAWGSTPASITGPAISTPRFDLMCPDGIDVYFENVGGALQKAVYPAAADLRADDHVRDGRAV